MALSSSPNFNIAFSVFSPSFSFKSRLTSASSCGFTDKAYTYLLPGLNRWHPGYFHSPLLLAMTWISCGARYLLCNEIIRIIALFGIAPFPYTSTYCCDWLISLGAVILNFGASLWLARVVGLAVMLDEVGNERVWAGGVVRRVGERQDVLVRADGEPLDLAKFRVSQEFA
jgi:hypothetical protein